MGPLWKSRVADARHDRGTDREMQTTPFVPLVVEMLPGCEKLPSFAWKGHGRG